MLEAPVPSPTCAPQPFPKQPLLSAPDTPINPSDASREGENSAFLPRASNHLKHKPAFPPPVMFTLSFFHPALISMWRMQEEKKKKKKTRRWSSQEQPGSDIDPETVDKSHGVIRIVSNACGLGQTRVPILALPFLDMRQAAGSLHISGPRSAQQGH